MVTLLPGETATFTVRSAGSPPPEGIHMRVRLVGALMALAGLLVGPGAAPAQAANR